jgi:hypothetical protein
MKFAVSTVAVVLASGLGFIIGQIIYWLTHTPYTP